MGALELIQPLESLRNLVKFHKITDKLEVPVRVLVTGNRGYIGTVLTQELLAEGYEVVGLDTDYYRGCEIYDPQVAIPQIEKDIRFVEADDFIGIDAIIHLAALSNDPLGEFRPGLTDEINFKATLKIAQLAKQQGVKRFVYASSQSMYGIGDESKELDEDDSEKNPVTAYARTKWEAECALKELGSDDFIVTCFRPSTVFGASPKLRCDIVFNNFVACAYTTGRIEIKSDGTPWRPVVHVKDVSKAFIAGLKAPADLVQNRSYNVGIPNGNFRVMDLAEAAGSVVPGCEIVITGEHGSDSRTYRVGFDRILTELKDYYQPEWTLKKGGEELVSMFDEIKFSDEHFRGRSCNRLLQLKYLVEKDQLDQNLVRR